MGSHNYIWEGEQSLGDRAWQDHFGHILKYEICFLLVYVQAYRKEFMFADACNQVICANQTTSGGIDKDYPILHFSNGLCIDQMLGFLGKRAVKTDQITLGQQFVQRYIFHAIQVWIWEKIISDNLHAKASADSCHSLADFSGSDDAGGFAVEVYTHQTA